MMQDAHRKLNPRLPWQKQLSTRTGFSTAISSLNLRKKPVECYIWSIPSYDAETWTLQKVDYKYPESFEMWLLEKDGEDQLVQSHAK